MFASVGGLVISAGRCKPLGTRPDRKVAALDGPVSDPRRVPGFAWQKRIQELEGIGAQLMEKANELEQSGYSSPDGSD